MPQAPATCPKVSRLILMTFVAVSTAYVPLTQVMAKDIFARKKYQ